MREDISDAIDALRQALVDSKASIDYVNDPGPIDDDKRLASSRISKRLSISIVALDDIKKELQSQYGAEAMHNYAPKDPLAECRDALAVIVADLREQNAHAGFERPDSEYVDVQLKAGDIRRAVAAVNRP